jgi:DNA-binding protein HU-beta
MTRRGTYSRADIVSAVARRLNRPESEVDAVAGAIITALAAAVASGTRVELRPLGTFEVKERAPRKGYDFKTGGTLDIPAKRTVKFKPGAALRSRV